METVELTRAALEVIAKHSEAMVSELRGLLGAGADSSTQEGTLAAASTPEGDAAWVEVERLVGQTYRWPDDKGGLEFLDPFVVYESKGLALAVSPVTNRPELPQTWVSKMSADLKSKRPLTPFIAADDYAETGEMVALIRGKGASGRQMFGPPDALPSGYEHLQTAMYCDRRNGGYRKYCVVAHRDDAQTMLRHCAMQVALRGL